MTRLCCTATAREATTGTARWKFSGSSAKASPSPAATIGAGTKTSTRPTISRSLRRTTTPIASRRPSIPRLPGGGGYPVCQLADVSPAKFGRIVNRVNLAQAFGEQTEVYDGFDLTGKIRLRNGAQVSGGMNIGRTLTDRCFVIDSPQELLNCRCRSALPAELQVPRHLSPPDRGGSRQARCIQAIPGPEITATRAVH